MTDLTRPTVGPAPEDKPTHSNDKTTARAGHGKGRRHPAARTRIAAAGIGVGALVGLASNMEVTYNRAHPAVTKPLSTAATRRAIQAANHATATQAVAVIEKNRPIVLAVHTIVQKVNAPATSGGYVGSSYSASAPASASAPVPPPVATTSGSTGGG